MATNSNQKGKRGEREAAELLRKFGFEARRGQQYAGGNDSPDVVHSMRGFHVEVKRTERFLLWDAMAQAKADRKPGEDVLILHRANNKPWVVVMDAEEFLRLMVQYVYTEE